MALSVNIKPKGLPHIHSAVLNTQILGYHALTENFVWLFISPDLTAVKFSMVIHVKQSIICYKVFISYNFHLHQFQLT
jgi:hypothetical protein